MTISRITVPMASPTVWLSTPEGLVDVDLVAVEKAANGQRKGWRLTEAEARYAARLMFESKAPYSVVAERVGVSTATLRKWFPEHVVPASPSMARPGARRDDEKPCERCKWANAAADRHYRIHGTYLGAPEATAGTRERVELVGVAA
jgi:hypothetical protein